MGFFRRIYNAMAGPPRVDYGHGGEAAEAEAAINEEFPAAAADEAAMKRAQAPKSPRTGFSMRGTRQRDPGTGAFEIAEAEADDESAPDSKS
jgi:hypothetical protein